MLYLIGVFADGGFLHIPPPLIVVIKVNKSLPGPDDSIHYACRTKPWSATMHSGALYCFLHTFLKAPLVTVPNLLFCVCFYADEMKYDFDSLGPDATLQGVGNGTGELKMLKGDQGRWFQNVYLACFHYGRKTNSLEHP